MGCKVSSASNSYPTIIIPSYKIVVVQTDKFYNLVTFEGKELAPANKIEEVYLTVIHVNPININDIN